MNKISKQSGTDAHLRRLLTSLFSSFIVTFVTFVVDSFLLIQSIHIVVATATATGLLFVLWQIGNQGIARQEQRRDAGMRSAMHCARPWPGR